MRYLALPVPVRVAAVRECGTVGRGSRASFLCGGAEGGAGARCGVCGCGGCCFWQEMLRWEWVGRRFGVVCGVLREEFAISNMPQYSYETPVAKSPKNHSEEAVLRDGTPYELHSPP